MINDKNQIIRSMKSYEEGGASDDSCMEEYVASDGKRKRRRKKGGCGKVTRFRSSSGSNNGGGVLGALLGIGAAAGAGLGLKKMLQKEKVGGTVKKMSKGGSLKPVPSDKSNSLGKLPTTVRNKMGFQKKGGAVRKKK